MENAFRVRPIVFIRAFLSWPLSEKVCLPPNRPLKNRAFATCRPLEQTTSTATRPTTFTSEDAFAFVPPTWVLPMDAADLELEMGQSRATYIAKPSTGTFLTRRAFSSLAPKPSELLSCLMLSRPCAHQNNFLCMCVCISYAEASMSLALSTCSLFYINDPDN